MPLPNLPRVFLPDYVEILVGMITSVNTLASFVFEDDYGPERTSAMTSYHPC